MSLWTLCNGEQYITPLSLESWRVVEAQHVLSARDLVDSIEEHDLLEAMIEASKPPIATETHYLIFTPFRYPPLKYGSRFGGIYEPSLWYGSLELETAFTETAYYRLKFFNDTSAELGYIELSMTAFMVSLISNRVVDLTVPPFHQHTKDISNKNTYEHSQLLGSDMRAASVEVFLYFSARTTEPRKNIASFTSAVLQLQHHQQNWRCFSNKERVEFTRMDISGKQRFSFSTSSTLA